MRKARPTRGAASSRIQVLQASRSGRCCHAGWSGLSARSCWWSPSSSSLASWARCWAAGTRQRRRCLLHHRRPRRCGRPGSTRRRSRFSSTWVAAGARPCLGSMGRRTPCRTAAGAVRSEGPAHISRSTGRLEVACCTAWPMAARWTKETLSTRATCCRRISSTSTLPPRWPLTSPDLGAEETPNTRATCCRRTRRPPGARAVLRPLPPLALPPLPRHRRGAGQARPRAILTTTPRRVAMATAGPRTGSWCWPRRLRRRL
mmetsp:Transcript_161412/g.518247  ORF Transcript_161412/g.518247 Transcript_161412/m.518247 type:complete len:260 (-) Transcript_161412:960-1739(-)